MTTGSGGLDVLRVLDTDAAHADAYRIVYGVYDSTPQEMAAESAKARAAIAELIAAAKRANGDHTAPDDCYATGPLTGDPIRDLVECPGCALAAALAAMVSP